MKAGWRLRTLILGAASTAAMNAWVPLGGDLWPDGPIAISFDLVRTAPPGSTGDWDAAVLEAMALWNAKLQRVQLVRATQEGEAWYHNGRSELFFDRNEYDDPFPSGVLAVSFASHDRGVLVENDIIFNRNRAWAVYRGAPGNGPADLRRVAVHELGHLLGLDHPDEVAQNVSAVMNSRVSAIEAPTADDEAGARALYDFGSGAAPVIVAEPRALEVKQGARATLSVLAGGRGPMTYEWRRNGVTVAGATADRLIMPAVTLGDAGDYVAHASNGAGRTISKPAALRVQPARLPRVSISISAASVETGASVILEGTVADGDEPLRYTWRRNGIAIPGASTPRLKLDDVQFSDAGDYAFAASNIIGSATSEARRLEVRPRAPPRLLGEIPSSSVEPGGSIALFAPVDASQAATFQWLKDGVAIPGATELQLRVAAFGAAQAGRYQVIVSNAVGSVMSASAELSAFPPAVFNITRQPASATATLGEAVEFSVETDGAAATYLWFKDGVAVPGATAPTLALSRITFDQGGIYAVEVGSGTARLRSQSARLVVLQSGNLVVMRHPAHHTVTAGSSVSLSAEARQFLEDGITPVTNPPLAWQWFKDGQPMAGRTTAELTFIAAASTAGRYHARVATSGAAVESEAAEVETVQSPRLFASHPASALFVANTEELRLTAVAAEVAFRRGQRENAVYFNSRGGVPISGTPFAGGTLLPGVYTLTIGNGTVTETSRPYHLGFVASSGPTITRHPQGGAVEAGGVFLLRVLAGQSTNLNYQWYRNGAALFNEQGRELVVRAFGANDFGDYTVLVSTTAGSAISEPARVEFRGTRTPLIRTHPANGIVREGDVVSLRVVTWRAGLRFQWLKNGRPIEGATNVPRTFVADRDAVGDYAVVVTDGIMTETSRTAQLTLMPLSQAPQILVQPADTLAVAGGEATFAVGVDGIPLPDRYQWRKNGVDLPGAHDAKLRLRNLRAEDAGSYSVVAYNAHGSATSRAATLTIDARGRLINLATRAAVGRGADILIAGFVLRGAAPREVLVRGIGEQLGDFGVSGVVRDPVITLRDSKGTVLATNDDWFRTGESNMEALRAAARSVGAFAQREDAHDGALIATLPPGNYTAQVTGLANTTGIGLVEIYELGPPSADRLINLSSRAMVGTGANILIPGLVLSGQAPRRLLFRAVGPGLAELGVAGSLSDPVMKVLRGDDVIAQNDNWGEQPGAAPLAPAMATVGAFPLRVGSRDAALLLDLPPGNYTVQVSGAGGATGVALVEVYEATP